MNPPRPLTHRFDYAAHPNFVVLGVGQAFTPPEDLAIPALACFWRFTDGDWTNDPIRNHRQTDIIYAYPMRSAVARDNPGSVEFYNPWVVGHPNWAPTRAVVPPPRDMDVDEDEDEDEDEEDDALTFEEMIADREVGTAFDGEILTLEVINAARISLGMTPHEPPMDPLPEIQARVDEAFNQRTEVAATQPTAFTPPNGSAKLFCLTFNGTPLDSIEELVTVASPILEVVTTVITTILWSAQWGTNPDTVLDRFQDAEPVLIACLGYTPIAQQAGVAIVEVATPAELAEQPVGALIVRAAAGALLSGGMSNHFRFDENGGLVINPENPPSLQQGYDMMGRVFSTEETAERLKNFSRWAQGALIADMQRFFGDAFEMDAVCRATERTYNTLNACLNTHLRWGHRRDPRLSFTHYKEVEFSTLAEEDKVWVLERSAEMGLVVADQRKLQSYIRTYGRESFATDMPADRAELFQRLEVRSVNRNYLFMLGGLQYEYRGPFEHIPNGANTIVNADTKQFLDRDGRAMEARTWVPVGVEVPPLRGHATTNAAGVEEARATGETPRRSTGGNTHNADPADEVIITPEAAEEAAAEANRVITMADPEMARRVLEDAMNEHLREHPEELPPGIRGIIEQTGPIVEVALTQPNPDTETNAAVFEFTSELFSNEAGARRLLAMTGYPVGMPEELQSLLDDARTQNARGNRAISFRAYMEAADDFLCPF